MKKLWKKEETLQSVLSEKSVHVEDSIQVPEGTHIRYEGVKEFWTKREYEYQELIINGIVVHREIPGKAIRTIPFARVDIFYDGPEGKGRKGINGVEQKVYKEAKKFLSYGELTIFNDKWRAAKYEGKYTFHDPMSRTPIYDKDLPTWIVDNLIKKKKKNIKKIKNKAVKESEESLNKAFEEFIGEKFDLPKEKVKPSPLQDLFLTKDIDPKDVTEKGALSTLYKHINGDRELSKGKAIEYAKTLGVAPATLMFEPKTINVWSNVKLSNKIEAPDGSVAILPGECYERLRTEVTVCPSDIYRLDVKAIRINDPDSIYDGFMAYYYETDKVSEAANNKLCMIRTKNKGKTLLGGYYKYYLGIFQIFGTKKMVVNPDPLSEHRVIASDIEPDVVAPIVSFTKPSAILADKVLSDNIKNVQSLGKLIRKEEEIKQKVNQVALQQQTRIKVKEMEIAHVKLFAEQKALQESLKTMMHKFQAEAEARDTMKKSFFGKMFEQYDDDIKIPELLEKDEKKRA